MKKIIFIVITLLFNFNSHSFSNTLNCDEFKKFSVNYMKCKASLIKDKTVSAGKNFIDDTKNLIIKNKQLENIYLEFTNEVNDFPASLHINTYPSSQGKGVGSMLINNAINEKKVLNKDYKIHLITHIDSSNVKFYEKLKFRIQKTDSERRVFLGLTYY